MTTPLTITLAGLVFTGPALVRWEISTTIDQGFNSGAVAPAFGLPQPYEIGTLQDFGLWNYAEFDVREGDTVTIPPSLLPTSLRWRLSVNGVMWSHPAGVAGFQPLDQNLDGFVDGADYDLWMEWFEAGDERSDFNGDGFPDGIDADVFSNEWSTR